MPRPPRQPVFWLICFVLWFGGLWLLSSRSGDETRLPAIPGFDKVAHFGYFFGGGGLLAAFLFRLAPRRPRWLPSLLLIFVIMGSIGWLDEVHQSYVPGRVGNDPGDWIADVTGAITGALVFRKLHRRLL